MNTIKVGLLGFGTVGTGVVRNFQNNSELIQQRLYHNLVLAKIATRDVNRDRGVQLQPGVLTSDIDEVIANPEIDIVIELIGGYEPAKSYILKAIANGKHIVTANKALMAVHGQEIIAAADRQGVSVMFDAAVGGSIPIISAIKENLCSNKFSSVLGILNGTCNFILTKMSQEGLDFAPTLQEAQELGYAEADPTLDVEGIDTAHKIALLAALCFGTTVDFDKIYTEGISNISALDILFAEQMGYTIKLLAIGKNRGPQIEVRVHPTMIPRSYQLAQVNGVFNAVRLIGDFAGPTLLYGSGAGMDATASAVMGDVMAISRDLIAGGKPRISILGYNIDKIKKLPIMAMGEVVSNYYLRFTTKDQTRVLAKIAGCLGAHNISIQSMLQPEKREIDSVSIVIMTHEAKEADINSALEEIEQLDVVLQPTRLVRVENAPL